MYNAVVVFGRFATSLTESGLAIHFVCEAYRHGKPIAAVGDAPERPAEDRRCSQFFREHPFDRVSGGLVRISLQLTSQRALPIRKHELDRATQAGLAHRPHNFLLGFQVF
jgi:hypothetical protein